MDLATLDDLNEGQKKFVAKALYWFKGDYTKVKPYFKLEGGPGTGKTFSIKYLMKLLDLEDDNIAFASYTGNAAVNMMKNGTKNAYTLHKLIYHCYVKEIPILDKRKPHKYFIEDKEVTKAKYEKYEKEGGTDCRKEDNIIGHDKEIKTELRDYLDDNIKLIIVDEYSMVSQKIIDDLLSFKIKTLFIGDPDQLMPIRSENNLINQEPDARLTEIMRQKEGNPIISLSQKIKNKIAIPYGTYNKKVGVYPKYELNDDIDFTKRVLLNADQIICYTNKTRRYLNDLCREFNGYDINKFLPQVGEKIICTQNNWDLEAFSPLLNTFVPLVNGTVGYVKDFKIQSAQSKSFIIDFQTEFDPECIFKDIKISFMNFDPDFYNNTTFNYKDKNKPNIFDFGYAVTCHKAQGNQYNKIVVVAENMFNKNRKFQSDIENDRRWLYTALTRAIDRAIIFIDGDYYNDDRYIKSDEFWDKLDEAYEDDEY